MKEDRKRKHKKRFRVIMEIVFMVLGILCSIMPYPYPLLVPIGIGVIRIISNAVQREKMPETQPVVYCNGVQERHTVNSDKRANNAKKSKKEQKKGETQTKQSSKKGSKKTARERS